MSALWSDLRFALRLFAKAPGHTAVLVLTLALGIGASTTIFSVVHSVVLQPLPFRAPERLVRVYTQFPRQGLDRFWVSPPEYHDFAVGCRSCESVAGWASGTVALAGGDRPLRVRAVGATASLLPTLGVAPAMGRFYSADEDLPGADPTVVVLGHAAWQRAFGGDPSIIGRKIRVDAMPVTVVGVMPEGFDFPDGAEAWQPAGLKNDNEHRGSHYVEVVARLKAGTSLPAARAELDSLLTAWSAGHGEDDHHLGRTGHTMIEMPLQAEVVGSLATSLWLLQGAVLFVLLIAVANVANLLLARAESRGREVAVRHALGATRGRLIRQLLTESVLLGLVGGALGILVAVWALDATVALIPASAPRVREIRLDGAALAFALGCTLASSLLFGLAPILHTRRADVSGALKDGSPRTTASRSRLHVRRALVIAEVALAVVLVLGCGLMVRSFVALQRVDAGFKPDHVLTFELELPEKAYSDVASVTAFWARLEDRLKALPGVTAEALVGGLPPSRQIIANDLELPGKMRDPKGPVWSSDYWLAVSSGWQQAMGVRIVRGRGLDARDARGAPAAVVINEAFATRFFPGEDPVGKPVQIVPWMKDVLPQTIVGVVADIKQAGLDHPAGTEVIFALDQIPDFLHEAKRNMAVMLRTSGDPTRLAPAVQRLIAEMDPTLPVWHLRTMDDLLWEAVARPRFLTFLLAAFAVLAMTLAGIGIYGVMAYSVAQRTHEIGIRMALGARGAEVRRMVLRQAALLAAAGVAVGLCAAMVLRFGLGASMSALLFGGGLGDPLLLVGVAAVVIAAALIATALPARRATRVQPTVALRAE